VNSLAMEVQKSVTYVSLRGCEVQEDRIGSKFVFYVQYYIMTWSDLLLLLLLYRRTLNSWPEKNSRVSNFIVFY